VLYLSDRVRQGGMYNKGQRYLAEDPITMLSPIMAVNGFVQSGSHLIHDSLKPHESDPK